MDFELAGKGMVAVVLVFAAFAGVGIILGVI